jgi:hypothetical protein
VALKHCGTLALALLVISAGAVQAQQAPTPLVAGQVRHGALTDRHPRLGNNSHMECFLLPTTAGQNYEVVLTSREFDANLMLDPGGCNVQIPSLSNNNFRSGTTDARIRFTATGATYGVYVNAIGAGRTGRYGLRAAETTESADTPASAAAATDYDLGWAAMRERNYGRAAQLLRPYAEAGNADAQNAMGYLTFYGYGVTANRLESGRWYGLAAEQGHEEARRRLNEIAPHIMEAQFVDHIDRYGPDMTDPASFHYDVSVYCIYSGPNCHAWRARYQQFEGAWNRAAESANMRRLWGVYTGGPDDDGWRRARERSDCMRRVTESIQRQTYGQQTWQYVNSC